MSVLSRLSTQELKAISDLFQQRSEGLKLHEAQLQTEASDPDESAFHGASRHGHQTGWEAQLVRLVTGRTPDQPDDPVGSKDAVQKYRDKEALPRNQRGKIRYAKADSVGSFLCPEVQSWAMSMARTKASPLLVYSWAETKSKTATQWVEYDYIDTIFAGNLRYTGVSFVRPKNAKKVAEADAVQAIEDFINQKRLPKDGNAQPWEKKKKVQDIMESVGVAGPNYRLGNKADYPLRFPSMADLLEYLGVDAHWMKSANVTFRKINKTGTPTWTIHTMYAVNCTAFPKPEICTPSVKTGKWTGNLRKTKDGPVTHIAPESLL
jgi:hypothetical protein